jgi:Tol biopolymer transport system component
MGRLIKVLFIVFAIAVLIFPQWIAHARLTPLSVDAVTKLSGLMVAGGEVNSFEISPDGNYVVFRADKDLAGKIELYSVDLQSLELEKLNQNIPDDYDISNILISPDSQWVDYSVFTSSNGRYLRSVPIGGGDSKMITQIPHHRRLHRP